MKTEVTIALVSGLVALLSAGIAYRSENHVAQLQHELQSTHEREMAQLSSDLTNQSQKELTFLRTKLEQQHERQIPFLKEQMRLYFEAVEICSRNRTSHGEIGYGGAEGAILAALLGPFGSSRRPDSCQRHGSIRKFAKG